jgi:hypothetical protein
MRRPRSTEHISIYTGIYEKSTKKEGFALNESSSKRASPKFWVVCGKNIRKVEDGRVDIYFYDWRYSSVETCH